MSLQDSAGMKKWLYECFTRKDQWVTVFECIVQQAPPQPSPSPHCTSPHTLTLSHISRTSCHTLNLQVAGGIIFSKGEGSDWPELYSTRRANSPQWSLLAGVCGRGTDPGVDHVLPSGMAAVCCLISGIHCLWDFCSHVPSSVWLDIDWEWGRLCRSMNFFQGTTLMTIYGIVPVSYVCLINNVHCNLCCYKILINYCWFN